MFKLKNILKISSPFFTFYMWKIWTPERWSSKPRMLWLQSSFITLSLVHFPSYHFILSHVHKQCTEYPLKLCKDGNWKGKFTTSKKLCWKWYKGSFVLVHSSSNISIPLWSSYKLPNYTFPFALLGLFQHYPSYLSGVHPNLNPVHPFQLYLSHLSPEPASCLFLLWLSFGQQWILPVGVMSVLWENLCSPTLWSNSLALLYVNKIYVFSN